MSERDRRSKRCAHGVASPCSRCNPPKVGMLCVMCLQTVKDEHLVDYLLDETPATSSLTALTIEQRRVFYHLCDMALGERLNSLIEETRRLQFVRQTNNMDEHD